MPRYYSTDKKDESSDENNNDKQQNNENKKTDEQPTNNDDYNKNKETQENNETLESNGAKNEDGETQKENSDETVEKKQRVPSTPRRAWYYIAVEPEIYPNEVAVEFKEDDEGNVIVYDKDDFDQPIHIGDLAKAWKKPDDSKECEVLVDQRYAGKNKLHKDTGSFFKEGLGEQTEVHPLFTRAWINLKKKIYYNIRNCFVPAAQRVDTRVYPIIIAEAFQEFRRLKKFRYKEWRRDIEFDLRARHPLFYSFVFGIVKRISRRPRKGGMKGGPAPLGGVVPVKEVLDNRKWVFEDVLADKSSPNYDPHEHPIAMLADDYYASRWDEDVYFDDEKNNNIQDIIDMRREPVRVNHFGHTMQVINKRSKSYAIVEGIKQYSTTPIGRFMNRVMMDFSLINTIRRSWQSYFKKKRNMEYKHRYKRYRETINPYYRHREVERCCRMVIKTFFHAVESNDIRLISDHTDPEEEDLFEEIFERQEHEYHHPSVLENGRIQEKSLTVRPARLVGIWWEEESDTLRFKLVCHRIHYNSKRRKYRQRRYMFVFYYSVEDRQYLLHNVYQKGVKRRRLP